MKYTRLGISTAAILLMLSAGTGQSGDGSSSIQNGLQEHSKTQLTTDSSSHLGTARFTTHQPKVLEQIGAHHAYALGLSGRGIRIAIVDTVVDYTQRREFGNRVKTFEFQGANLAQWRPYGHDWTSEVQRCQNWGTCDIWEGWRDRDTETVSDWVKSIVEDEGWPSKDDSAFILDRDNDEWYEIPSPYSEDGFHGTAVASVAAGSRLGVAPQSTLITHAINLEDDPEYTIWHEIEGLDSWEELEDLDSQIGTYYAEIWNKFDVVNGSFGMSLAGVTVQEYSQIEQDVHDRIAFAREYLPNYWRAYTQAGRDPSGRSVIVIAAGNDSLLSLPPDESKFPYYVPEVRGHWLAVVATDPDTKRIAGYSNRCGPLPSDWQKRKHGPHYCLTAPGNVHALVPDVRTPGRGAIAGPEYMQGTSFAAPVVSGALALMMEHFRGTKGNTEIVRRMLDTADRSGAYADLETYGAGHLDLEAALSPVGALTAGQTQSPLKSTVLQTPAAFGAVAQRATGIELAAFDEQGFPFWSPIAAFVVSAPDGRSPIPSFTNDGRGIPPSAELTPRRMQWVETGADSPTWIAGYAPGALSLVRVPGTEGWGYGISYSDGEHLGGKTSGAFGARLRSGSLWTSRSFTHDLGRGISLRAEGTLAVSLPEYESNALFSASPALLSAATVRLGVGRTGLTVEQPLRAEAGTGTFRVENGIIENGRRLVNAHRISLPPAAREISVTLRHDVKAMGGAVAFALGGSVHAGHVSGTTDARVGVAYRTHW